MILSFFYFRTCFIYPPRNYRKYERSIVKELNNVMVKNLFVFHYEIVSPVCESLILNRYRNRLPETDKNQKTVELTSFWENCHTAYRWD